MAKHARGKQPHYFTAKDGSPALTMAGLWDEWKDRENPDMPLRSCPMIITAPNEFVGEVHDRMPAILRPDQYDGCPAPWARKICARSTTTICRGARSRAA
jgi:putative SOS response-associated peptidase YedK